MHITLRAGPRLLSLAIAATLLSGTGHAVAAQGFAVADTIFFVQACPHDNLFQPTHFSCGGDSLLSTFRGADVASMQLTVRLKNGKSYTQNVPVGSDALFMSNLAISEFVIPYYQSLRNAHGDSTIRAARAFISRLKVAPRPKPVTTKSKKPE